MSQFNGMVIADGGMQKTPEYRITRIDDAVIITQSDLRTGNITWWLNNTGEIINSYVYDKLTQGNWHYAVMMSNGGIEVELVSAGGGSGDCVDYYGWLNSEDERKDCNYYAENYCQAG